MQRGPRPTWQLACLLAAALLMGCKESQQASTASSTVVDPSASFDRVVQNLRHYLRKLESEPYAVIEDGAYIDFRHSREVTGQEFKPPSEDGDEYRGAITITTKWTYSFRPPAETEDEESKEKEGKAPQSNSELPQEGGVSGEVEILDPSVVADLPRSVPRDPSALAPHRVMSDEDEEVQTFHFVFRDDRWELVPQPLKPIDPAVAESGRADVNTNQAVEEAVELALKRQ